MNTATNDMLSKICFTVKILTSTKLNFLLFFLFIFYSFSIYMRLLLFPSPRRRDDTCMIERWKQLWKYQEMLFIKGNKKYIKILKWCAVSYVDVHICKSVASTSIVTLIIIVKTILCEWSSIFWSDLNHWILAVACNKTLFVDKESSSNQALTGIIALIRPSSVGISLKIK